MMFNFLVAFIFSHTFAGTQDWKANESVSIRLRMADRFYVESVFAKVFGPSGKKISHGYLFEAASVFGGPCDYYEQVRIGVQAMDFADLSVACPNGKMSFSLPMVPAPNILREAYVARICQDVVADSDAFEFALKKIHGKKEVSAPGPKTLKIAFQRFFPEREPAPDFLSQEFSSADSKEDQWKSTLQSLCVDPHWQIL